MEVKLGGNLFYMMFNKELDLKNSMVVGIDVEHSGPSSVVGFCSSIDTSLTKYYSNVILQEKGQEIV